MTATDYLLIKEENKVQYGMAIDRVGKTLLANRYGDRTHFIYELLQNAEDALAKRDSLDRRRSVHFRLSEHELRVTHFGKPFDERDVRGICGIAESTKEITQIGRFGIGFKSVYAFTDKPEIHSGAEDFGIENFVWPVAVPEIQRETEETVIIMPLRDAEAHREIQAGLQRLGPGALLFLRSIEGIEWNVEGGSSFYIRQADQLDNHVRKVTIIGQMGGQQSEIEQTWLVFSRPMELTGDVEIAFFMQDDQVRPVAHSRLVVFFPTVVETDLGFCVQGPYRTTLSRDNVPPRDEWNRRCVQETARILADALVWLRDKNLLDITILRCLPIDQNKFDDESMFAPLYEETKRVLTSKSLLPRFGGGYVAARNAKLARTRELRELFDSDQLVQLLSSDKKLAWLSSGISQDRTPELRTYLMGELNVAEVTPQAILREIDAAFMDAQNDEWVRRLYEFLNGQVALKWQAKKLPLIRLSDGTHVQAYTDDQPQAFLPGTFQTDFPTVRASVYNSEDARSFLLSLGLTEPDPVDDVIRNILPKYSEDASEIPGAVYKSDIRRFINVYKTDSRRQRDKLVEALRTTPFVSAMDMGNKSRCRAQPGDLYWPTERLTNLFSGIAGVKLVDHRCTALHGEDARDLLVACGAGRYLRPTEDQSLSWKERRELRKQKGQLEWSSDTVEDKTLLGLDNLLSTFSELSLENRRKKAKLLWEELTHLEDQRGKAVFTGIYCWTWYGRTYRQECDSAFVRRLNKSEWVPDHEGNLQRPELISFESLDWISNDFLLSKIRFKPPVIDELAKEAGFEPEVLDLLKKEGITSKAELIARLGLTETSSPEDDSVEFTTPEDAINALLGDTPDPTPPTVDADDTHSAPAGPTSSTADTANASGRTSGGTRGNESGEHRGRRKDPETTRSRSASGNVATRTFISYVAVHSEDEPPDPDGLKQSVRMALEKKAIDFILSRERNWKRTPGTNPGYDLFEPGPDGTPVRWCEVKAMTGSLDDRPVGVSRKQFELACLHGADYWIFVVERASGKNPRIVRIQDPAGRARTFTFDRGWLSVAQVDC